MTTGKTISLLPGRTEENFGLIAQYIQGLVSRFGSVQARQALLQLDDRMLKDIGLTRNAVELADLAELAPGRRRH